MAKTSSVIPYVKCRYIIIWIIQFKFLVYCKLKILLLIIVGLFSDLNFQNQWFQPKKIIVVFFGWVGHLNTPWKNTKKWNELRINMFTVKIENLKIYIHRDTHSQRKKKRDCRENEMKLYGSSTKNTQLCYTNTK